MPRIKSAKKRVDIAERNRQRNVALKSAIRTALKKVLASVATPESTLREDNLKQAYSLIDRAVLKGIIHKNTAARYKSRAAIAVQKSA